MAQTQTDRPGPMTVKTAKVIAECAFHTARGLEQALGSREYFVSDKAMQFWLDRYSRSIRVAMRRPTADWDGRDRNTVLARCAMLGATTASLAMETAPGTGMIEVTVDHAQVAARRVARDKTCRAARLKAGAGGYCDY